MLRHQTVRIVHLPVVNMRSISGHFALLSGLATLFLSVGPTRYTLRTADCQPAGYPGIVFVALDPAPYPTTLGTVTVEAQYSPYSPSASQSVTADLTLADAAVPFSGLLQIELLVDGLPAGHVATPDGLPIKGTVTISCADAGSAGALILDSCGEVASVGPGPHGMTFSAHIPGAPSAITFRAIVGSAGAERRSLPDICANQLNLLAEPMLVEARRLLDVHLRQV